MKTRRSLEKLDNFSLVLCKQEAMKLEFVPNSYSSCCSPGQPQGLGLSPQAPPPYFFVTSEFQKYEMKARGDK